MTANAPESSQPTAATETSDYICTACGVAIGPLDGIRCPDCQEMHAARRRQRQRSVPTDKADAAVHVPGPSLETVQRAHRSFSASVREQAREQARRSLLIDVLAGAVLLSIPALLAVCVALYAALQQQAAQCSPVVEPAWRGQEVRSVYR